MLVGLSHFSGRLPDGSRGLNREGLLEWARERLDPALDASALASNDLDELRATLVSASQRRHSTVQ